MIEGKNADAPGSGAQPQRIEPRNVRMGSGAADPDREILQVRDVARLLGVSKRTVERYVAESRIPFFRLQRGKRGSVRFMRTQLLRWLNQLTIKSSRQLP